MLILPNKCYFPTITVGYKTFIAAHKMHAHSHRNIYAIILIENSAAIIIFVSLAVKALI